LSCVFFFQAEDGIRDFHVTGVQTCALPISFSDNFYGWAKEVYEHLGFVFAVGKIHGEEVTGGIQGAIGQHGGASVADRERGRQRSEERRVGTEGTGWR